MEKFMTLLGMDFYKSDAIPDGCIKIVSTKGDIVWAYNVGKVFVGPFTPNAVNDVTGKDE